MHLLITGGAGFVGSSLAISFAEKYPSYTITCLDNLKRRGSELNLPRLRERNIHFVHGDIRNPEDLAEINEFDCLIDASAEPSVLAGITSPVGQVVNNNLMGTVNLLELTKRNNASFIFLSTSRVYPIKSLESHEYRETETRFEWADKKGMDGISSKGVSERLSLEGSRSFYGATKLASELLIQEYTELAGVKAVVNRCGVISGPFQMGKVDQGVLVLWLARHFWKGQLSYIGYGGEGKQVRDFLHVDDLFHLLDLQIHDIDAVNGKTFNAGGGYENSLSLQELTSICSEITGNHLSFRHVKENRPADLRIYITDNSKVNSTLGWRPKKSPKEIVQDVFLWLENEQEALRSILN